MRALRRDARAADTFPDDVAELGAYLRGESLLPGVNAHPGKGTDVPLYILGSSLDRNSTRLNSSHVAMSYAVFCVQTATPDADILHALLKLDAGGHPSADAASHSTPAP